MSPPLVRLALDKTFVDEHADIAELQETFRRQHVVHLHGLVDEAFLAAVQGEVDRSEFYDRMHRGVGLELCMKRNGLSVMLELLTNDPPFVRFVERLTECGHIGSFGGRMYRIVSGAGHSDTWHGDVVEHRIVGMSINFSRAPYLGGVLEVRDLESQRVLARAENSQPGDAILFRIRRDLQHKLSDMQGDNPKTAYAGWFHAEPEFRDVLAKLER